jgi:hypothetical protein
VSAIKELPTTLLAILAFFWFRCAVFGGFSRYLATEGSNCAGHFHFDDRVKASATKE